MRALSNDGQVNVSAPASGNRHMSAVLQICKQSHPKQQGIDDIDSGSF